MNNIIRIILFSICLSKSMEAMDSPISSKNKNIISNASFYTIRLNQETINDPLLFASFAYFFTHDGDQMLALQDISNAWNTNKQQCLNTLNQMLDANAPKPTPCKATIKKNRILFFTQASSDPKKLWSIKWWRPYHGSVKEITSEPYAHYFSDLDLSNLQEAVILSSHFERVKKKVKFNSSELTRGKL